MIQPNPLSEPEIDLVRDASRRLVRRLGFLEEGLAGTGLPPSSVHALIEIEARPACTATDLAGVLLLEKSSVSRLVRRLVEAGLVSEAPGAADGRTKALALTGRGAALAAEIHGFARRQAAGALARLEPGQRRTVAEGIALYAEALGAEAAQAVTVEAGYRCGCIARCVELHALYYAREAGFGQAFEALVASGLAEFSGRLERPGNAIWLARRAGQVVGTVAIDGEDMGPGFAHLRWFIVAEEARGTGVGRDLLAAALRFCDAQGFAQTQLWTFRGLEAARRLYERNGFGLVEERAGSQWGAAVQEQRFVRARGGV